MKQHTKEVGDSKMQERKDVLGQRAVSPVNSNFGGNPQQKRPPQKQSLPLYYTIVPSGCHCNDNMDLVKLCQQNTFELVQ